MHPRWGREMLRKAWLRWSERDRLRERAASILWCKEHQSDAAAWARGIDARLWQEAQAFAAEQDQVAVRKSDEMGIRVGGAAFAALLHFVTRLLRPATVVETGVAFGFSSRAFLHALEENGEGRLWSSDFPYFRLADPERLIGCLIEPGLRDRWTLLVGSDRDNLPRIAADAGRIDLLHYDSDKSRSGRDYALTTFGPKLGEGAVIIFDDIQDNLHFKDWVTAEEREFFVFECNGKWIGMTGGSAQLYKASSALAADPIAS